MYLRSEVSDPDAPDLTGRSVDEKSDEPDGL